MKVMLINGSPHEKGCTYTALSEAAKRLNENGIDTEIYWIGAKPVGGCVACGACRSVGDCAFGELDGVNEAARKITQADGLIVGSPVHYAGPSGSICGFLDRVFYMASGKMRLKPAAAVVSCRRGGASAAFDRLNKYFTIAQMPVVASNYWNSVHGFTPDDVRKDEEGLQTMRTLADNMTWLLKCIEYAKDAVPKPVNEKKLMTNFIR